MEYTHLLSPHNNVKLHSIHMCRENGFLVRQLLIGHPAALCNDSPTHLVAVREPGGPPVSRTGKKYQHGNFGSPICNILFLYCSGHLWESGTAFVLRQEIILGE